MSVLAHFINMYTVNNDDELDLDFQSVELDASLRGPFI